MISVVSISAAIGAISPSANSRVAARSISCSSVSRKSKGGLLRSGILVEAAARLSSEASRRHHVAQQGAWSILGVSKSYVQDLHDVEAHVDADEIGERQRSHRMIHAELHDGIDRFA